MASKRNDLSSLIHGLDPDFYTGFHFHPTYEEGIRIVKIKNRGGELAPIFNVYGNLFQSQPEQLEECHCFTKLELLGKKVNRRLGDGSRRFWKNIKSEFVRDDNHNFIGWVTKLVLHCDKNTPTEWHILEYRDTERPDAGRWVLCEIYKGDKKHDSGCSGRFHPYICNTTVPEPVASDIGAGQIYPSTSQVSNMWASGAREDMYQCQHHEMGQCSNTQPDWIFNAGTYQLTGEYKNQDQIYGVDQSWNPPTDGMDYNSQQFTSNNTYSMGGTDMGVAQSWNPPTDGMDYNSQQFTSNNTYSMGGTDMGVAQSWNPPTDGMDYNSQQFTSNNTYSIGGTDMGPYPYSNLDDWNN